MQKNFPRIPIILLTLALTTLACTIGTVHPTQAPLGSVGGIITAETGEGLLEGVIVKLSSCTDEKIALSNSNGYFEFIGVPTGICVLEVSKDGWEYASAEPESGHPIPIVVEADKANALTIYMRPLEAASVEATATSAPTDVPPTATLDVTATPSAPMVTPIDQNVNCRFGPSVKYFATDALFVDKTVPILGRTKDSSWWQVDGPRNGYGKCFVAANVTQTSGDLSNIPVVSVSTGLVTAINLYTTVEPDTQCNAANHHIVITGTITTNGPASVEYRWWFGDGAGAEEYGNYETLNFSEYGEKSVKFETYVNQCFDYLEAQLQVRSPNQIAGRDSFSVEVP